MIRIDQVSIQNYRNIKEDLVEPAKNGIVFCGKNAIGKTSRIEAIYWALSHALFDNSTNNINEKIKTLKTGKREPVKIDIEITGEYDEKFFLSKTLQEKWSIKKASTDEVYEGDEISYSVNGTKKIKKEYDAIINRIFGIEHIVSSAKEDKKYETLKKINWFNLITNPTYFKRLDKKTQRELLIFAVGDYDVLKIEMSNSCREILSRATIDEAKKELKNDIRALNKYVENNAVKVSTLKNDVLGLVCQHCGEPIHIDGKIIENLEKESKQTFKDVIKLESLVAEIETVELEYLRLLDEKVQNTFQEFAHIEIIDDNMSPTLKLLFKDNKGDWIDFDNGINTGDGVLRIAQFISFLKLLLRIPTSIIFFDALESLDTVNFERLRNIDEQIFGTRVEKDQQKIVKQLIGRNKEEATVHEI